MNPRAYPKCNVQKANDISGITLIEDVEKILADKLNTKYRDTTEKATNGNCRKKPIIKVMIRVTINIDGII
jgi:hypothetical protein